MRFIIYGAGAIGGTVGARLFQAGNDVVLIARGEHLKAIKDKGLLFETPEEGSILKIPCFGHPSEIDFRKDDVVFLTVKTQHSLNALNDLRDAAGDEIPVICCQNGVANERMALRRFSHVYGMMVWLPATHLEPGAVEAESTPITGILDAGVFPSGIDSLIETVTKTLSNATFSALPDPDIMRWKYYKLLMNIRSNLLQVLCGSKLSKARDIMEMVLNEALNCYQAAGINCASREEFINRCGDLVKIKKVKGRERKGGSSWQSIVRGSRTVEADYLNGEIVFLGRLHRVPTPANKTLHRLMGKLVSKGEKPGSFSLEQLRKIISAEAEK